MTDTDPDQYGRLTVRRSTADGVRIIALHGELDQDTRQRAGHALNPPDGDTTPHTVADLTALTFMDSSGINTLIAAHLAATEAHGWLRVAGAQPQVLRLLRLVGIDTLIPCHPTVREALDS
ncbi:STAS domain-containing protein [Streptomyces sp. NPDC005423]|uniref:STAS domain-containing protein n=1 Tax=Streptomyces sp. NPDC005423 TaxID=3155343 RepID=UPI0033A7C4F2